MISIRHLVQLFAVVVYGLFAMPAAVAIDPPHTNDCLVCHNIKSPSYPTLLGTLCESCHFSGGPATEAATHSSRTTDNSYGNWDLDCWACHNPHQQEQNLAWGSTYGKFLKRSLNAQVKEIDPADPGPYYEALSTLRTVSSNNVEFKGPTEFVDNDAQTTDDICQVCHEQTSNYSSLAVNSHSNYGADSQPGGNCTACHNHTSGFAAADGGCLGCHSQTQPTGSDYRRQVADSDPGAPPPEGDFTRTSHHVTDLSTTEIVTEADCQVCHDQSNHQSNGDPQVSLRDPDNVGNSFIYDGTGGSIEGLCLNCHDNNGATAYDAVTPAAPDGKPFTDGRTPADIATTWASSSHNLDPDMPGEGCQACHGGSDSTRSGLSYAQNAHGSQNNFMLSSLVAGTTVTNVEEALCTTCHNGGVAATDIAAEFNKVSRHPVQSTQGLHDPSENAIVGARHVECADCHDPHATTDVPTGNVPGALQNLRGINIVGSEVKPITATYQLCFRCHADSTGKPAALTPRQLNQTNVRLEFNTANPSFHPVAGVGRNPNVPSLISPLTESSIITCGDCHSNDSSTGPAGPHGSIYSPLLVLRYETQDGTNESSSTYALCYSCHSRSSILGDNSFKEHDKHIRGENTPCNVCHDPHGVNLAQGNSTNNSKLINFDTSVVTPDSSGRLRFESTGTFKGRCYLRCHGKNHKPKSY